MSHRWNPTRQRVIAKSQRIQRLVQFYEQADYAHQQNYLSRDTSGLMAAKAALEAVGVWDHVDWWRHLPDQDLTAIQQEHLRESVYQQLLSLDGLLIKGIGKRLSGDRQLNSSSSFLTMLRRFIRTDAGKEEARAALLVSQRVRHYRPAESERWFTGMARFRLGDGKRAKATELGPSRNAADAHALGVLSLIASLDRGFRFFYGGYQDEDDLQVANDLFARSGSLRPDHYWTLLALAHSQALLAQRDGPDSDTPARNRYAPAIQTLGRCIALDPNNPFGYADRSAVYRMQAGVIKEDESLDASQRKSLETELLRRSLSDVERAAQMNSDQHWIHWHHGLSLLAVDQRDQAIDRFLLAATEGYPFSQTDDTMLIRFDDLHGREEAADALAEMAKQTPSDGRLNTVLAAIRLNQIRIDDAAQTIAKAIAVGSTDVYWSAVAHVVNGMILVQQENWPAAESSFAKAQSIAPDAWQHSSAIATWLRFGEATCSERKTELATALDQYRRALQVCVNDPHRATCALARARALALAGRFDESKDAIKLARDIEPACDVLLVARPLVDHYRELKPANPDASELASIERLVNWMGSLPRATKLDLDQEEQADRFCLALLNEGFELGMAAYWFDPSGASWFNEAGDRSVGEVTSKHARGGQYSLHIVGDAKPSDQKNLPSGVIDPVSMFDHAHGRTGQDFPALTGQRYRVSAWVRGEGLSDGSLWLVVNVSHPNGSTESGSGPASEPAEWNGPDASASSQHDPAAKVHVIKTLGGSYDWTRLVGEFQIPGEDDSEDSVMGELTNCRLEILSTGPGQAWIDDLEIERIEGER